MEKAPSPTAAPDDGEPVLMDTSLPPPAAKSSPGEPATSPVGSGSDEAASKPAGTTGTSKKPANTLRQRLKLAESAVKKAEAARSALLKELEKAKTKATQAAKRALASAENQELKAIRLLEEARQAKAQAIIDEARAEETVVQEFDKRMEEAQGVYVDSTNEVARLKNEIDDEDARKSLEKEAKDRKKQERAEENKRRLQEKQVALAQKQLQQQAKRNAEQQVNARELALNATDHYKRIQTTLNRIVDVARARRQAMNESGIKRGKRSDVPKATYEETSLELARSCWLIMRNYLEVIIVRKLEQKPLVTLLEDDSVTLVRYPTLVRMLVAPIFDDCLLLFGADMTEVYENREAPQDPAAATGNTLFYKDSAPKLSRVWNMLRETRILPCLQGLMRVQIVQLIAMITDLSGPMKVSASGSLSDAELVDLLDEVLEHHSVEEYENLLKTKRQQVVETPEIQALLNSGDALKIARADRMIDAALMPLYTLREKSTARVTRLKNEREKFVEDLTYNLRLRFEDDLENDLKLEQTRFKRSARLDDETSDAKTEADVANEEVEIDKADREISSSPNTARIPAVYMDRAMAFVRAEVSIRKIQEEDIWRRLNAPLSEEDKALGWLQVETEFKQQNLEVTEFEAYTESQLLLIANLDRAGFEPAQRLWKSMKEYRDNLPSANQGRNNDQQIFYDNITLASNLAKPDTEARDYLIEEAVRQIRLERLRKSNPADADDVVGMAAIFDAATLAVKRWENFLAQARKNNETGRVVVFERALTQARREFKPEDYADGGPLDADSSSDGGEFDPKGSNSGDEDSQASGSGDESDGSQSSGGSAASDAEDSGSESEREESPVRGNKPSKRPSDEDGVPPLNPPSSPGTDADRGGKRPRINCELGGGRRSSHYHICGYCNRDHATYKIRPHSHMPWVYFCSKKHGLKFWYNVTQRQPREMQGFR